MTRSPVRLHINVDHVATLRNARGTPYPDPVDAARACVDAGADGITAHLREDRRHIRDEDVTRLRNALRVTFNLEMAATDAMVAIASSIQPDVVTLVPERREERTTEGGLDVIAGGTSLAAQIEALRARSIRVSLFIAADPAQIEASARLGVEQVELHTGDYAHATGEAVARELARLGEGARLAQASGLDVAAGHGLTRANVPGIVSLAPIAELNIGHAVVSDAVFLGLGPAVRAFRHAMKRVAG